MALRGEMPIDIRPFVPGDLRDLEIQGAQAELRHFLSLPGYADKLAAAGPAYSGLVKGRVVGACGIFEEWRGRGRCWALFSCRIPAGAWLTITRATRRVLDETQAAGMRRIEATVDAEFGPGIRWVRLLGFKVEGYAEGYSPEGWDHLLYARYRP